jgi:hypothetical protein
MQGASYLYRKASPEGRAKDMASTSLFTCLCGVQKKTSNHWVLAKVTSGGITFMPWDIHLAHRDDIVVLCGEGCATALLSRSLGEWRQAEPVDDRELTAA